MPDDPLNLRLARELFSWAWRADWQAWCPPEWPTWADYTLRQDSPRFLGELFVVLATHATTFDDRGAPHVPPYTGSPAATALVWAWLTARPAVHRIQLMRRAADLDTGVGAETVCLIQVWATGCRVDVEDVGHGSEAVALCRAALAAAAALREEGPGGAV